MPDSARAGSRRTSGPVAGDTLGSVTSPVAGEQSRYGVVRSQPGWCRAGAQADRRARQYVLTSTWGEVQPTTDDENAYLSSHSWAEYGAWHLGLTAGANDETKARYAFGCGNFRQVHRMVLIACLYRGAEWRHKEVELASHDLLQRRPPATSWPGIFVSPQLS